MATEMKRPNPRFITKIGTVAAEISGTTATETFLLHWHYITEMSGSICSEKGGSMATDLSNPILYIPSSGLGLVIVGFYGYRCWRSQKKFGIGVAINIILSASGIIAGLLLILSTFFNEIKEKLNGIEIYMLIAGLAVSIVSFQTIRNYFIEDNNGSDPK